MTIRNRQSQKPRIVKRMSHKETSDNLNNFNTAPKYIECTTLTFYNTYFFFCPVYPKVELAPD